MKRAIFAARCFADVRLLLSSHFSAATRFTKSYEQTDALDAAGKRVAEQERRGSESHHSSQPDGLLVMLNTTVRVQARAMPAIQKC